MAKRFSLFAFWHYDRFPWCLSARVVQMKEDAFEPEGYTNHWFKMHAGVRLVPEATGKKLQADLKTLEADFVGEVNAIKRKYERLREEVFANHGVSPPQSITVVERAQELLKRDRLERKLGFKKSA